MRNRGFKISPNIKIVPFFLSESLRVACWVLIGHHDVRVILTALQFCLVDGFIYLRTKKGKCFKKYPCTCSLGLNLVLTSRLSSYYHAGVYQRSSNTLTLIKGLKNLDFVVAKIRIVYALNLVSFCIVYKIFEPQIGRL